MCMVHKVHEFSLLGCTFARIRAHNGSSFDKDTSFAMHTVIRYQIRLRVSECNFRLIFQLNLLPANILTNKMD